MHSKATSAHLPDLLQGVVPTPSSDTDEQANRYRHFESVATALAGSLESPTLIVVEDVHWADRPSLLLLRHLVRHPTLESALFVVTYRDDDVAGEQADRIENLASPSRTVTYQLRSFHDGEVRALVRAIASPERVDFLVSRAASLRDVTGGNPFFLRELLRELDESPELDSDGDLAPALSGLAPAKVNALIERRLARLTTGAQQMICAAAVIGGDLSTDLLEIVSGLPHDEFLYVVEECLAARLLVEDSSDAEHFHFPHALACNCVYAGIPTETRMHLHRRIAEAMESHSGTRVHVSTLARHFNEAAPLGCYAEAARFSELAGTEANSHFMFAEAANWFEHAVRWRSEIGSAEDSSLAHLELALARAYANEKQFDRAQTTFLRAAEIARRIRDHALLADIAVAAVGSWSSGYRPVLLPLLEEALERLDESDGPRRVRALSRIASELYFVDSEREGEMARQAVVLARALGDPEALAHSQLALHRWRTHDPAARAERLALSRNAFLQIREDRPESDVVLSLQRAMLGDLLENGLVEEFDTVLPEYEEASRSHGSPPDIYWSMALRATQAMLRGDLAAADQQARGAALRGHELEQLSTGALMLQRFVIRYQQARLSEEIKTLRGASQVNVVFVAGTALLATALSETHNQEDAERVVRYALGTDGSAIPRDIFWLGAVALFSGVAARGHDFVLQELLCEMLLPCRDNVVVFGAGGAVLGTGNQWIGRLQTALGDLDSAVDSFEASRTMNRDMGAPFWAAQAEIDACFALAARGRPEDRDECSRLAETATETAERLGFERILQQSLKLAWSS